MTVQTAKLVSLLVGESTPVNLYGTVGVKHLHSDSKLEQSVYSWQGEVELETLTEDDVLVTIDSFAYRARHQDTAKVITLRNGGYNHGPRDQFRTYKLMGVVRDGQLFVVTEQAGEKVEDIAPRAPVRVSGVGQAHRIRHKTFSSPKTEEKSA